MNRLVGIVFLVLLGGWLGFEALMDYDNKRMVMEDISYEVLPIEMAKEIEEVEEVVVEEIKKAPYANIPLADDLQVYLEERCEEMYLDYFLVIALMESESTFDSGAVGDSGSSVGLMQINKCWWDVMANEGIDIHTDKGNIDASLIILKDLYNKFDYSEEVIHCYKCGEYRGRELLRQGIIIQAALDVMDRAEVIRKEAN